MRKKNQRYTSKKKSRIGSYSLIPLKMCSHDDPISLISFYRKTEMVSKTPTELNYRNSPHGSIWKLNSQYTGAST